MKLLLAPVLILCVTPLVSAAPPHNLVVNGDFSKPLDPKGTTTGWKTEGSVTLVDASPASGKAVRLHCLGKGPVTCRQCIPLAPGSSAVEFSVKVRQGDVKSGSYEVILAVLDANKKALTPEGQPIASTRLPAAWLGQVYEVNPSPEWTTLRLDGKLPKNAAFLKITLISGPHSGSVEFTDVECEVRN